jgi:hypothetical protein
VRIVDVGRGAQRHRGPVLQPTLEIVVKRDGRGIADHLTDGVLRTREQAAVRAGIERQRGVGGAWLDAIARHQHRNQQRGERQKSKDRCRLMRAGFRMSMMLLLRFGYRPELLVVLFFFPENDGGCKASFRAMFGATVLAVNHRPQPPDLFPAQEAQHRSYRSLFLKLDFNSYLSLFNNTK